MKIHTRIKSGSLKGWTIRQSKNGWFDLYSSSGVSQTGGKNTLDQVLKQVEELESKLLTK